MNWLRAYIITVICVCGMECHAQESIDSVQTHLLQDVVVTDQSARNRIANARLGSEALELTKLSMAPKMFGEMDIINSITLLPGVQGEAEGAGGFEVRGGNAYQNLVTLDGMTLYNPAHLMGIFSTFNDDAMSRAILHKGPIPPNFGGASSSVLETYMRLGDMNKYHFSGTLGILNAKVSADGPIVKDRLSFALSARRSYVDLFLKLIPEYKSTVMNFFDVNAKMRYSVAAGNHLDVSFFASRDNLAISGLMDMRWGNISGSINWSVQKGGWRFLTTGTVTNYTTEMGMDIMDANQKLNEYINSYSAYEKISYSISDNHLLEFGVTSELLRVKSGDMKISNSRQLEILSGWLNAAWRGYESELSSLLSMSLGTRLSCYIALSGNRFHEFMGLNESAPDFSSKTYLHVEPRGSIKINLNDNHNIKVGASISTQYLHGVRSTTTTFPFDRYALTSAFTKPEVTTQYSAGYAGMTPDGGWDWSCEGYYKTMDGVYDYKDGETMFSRINLESLILSGKGLSYGIELMLRKNRDIFTGWVAYTLSKTYTRTPGINNGQWYKASNDRRHGFSIVGIVEFNRHWNASFSWTYSSGRPLTAPDEKYVLGGETCYYFTTRNSYKTPSSHGLDLSSTYTKEAKRFTSIIAFGVFNAYSHYSPFVIYFEDDSSKPSGTRAVQQSLFGIVPSISYTIKV